MLSRGGRGDDRSTRRRRQRLRRCTAPAVARGAPSRRRGRRSRRRSARGPARWSSPRAAPRPTTSRSRACTGRAATPIRPVRASSPAPSSITPCWTPSTGSPSTRARTVEWLPVDAYGRVHPRVAPRRRRSATPASVALATVMWANNEIGTIMPVRRTRRSRRRVRRPAARRRGAGSRPDSRSTSPRPGSRP